ncbi:UNVERIFIED_CONTAM: hypothetical protein GTU68_019484, partial [Idotea baltica]|nr:hypothetical protein [Idotea baltica]
MSVLPVRSQGYVSSHSAPPITYRRRPVSLPNGELLCHFQDELRLEATREVTHQGETFQMHRMRLRLRSQ